MRQRITKRAVDGLEPVTGKTIFLWDTEVTGFGVKVLGSGRKVYILQYRTREQNWKMAPRRLTLGAHGELTPDQARRRATEYLLEVSAGNDPADRSPRGPSPEASHPTVADLATRFLEEYLPSKKKPPGPKTIQDYKSAFRCHVIPALGDRRVDEVSAHDIEALHQWLRKKPYQANRVLTVLHQAFNQAERWEWRPSGSNPTRHIDRYPEERRGARKEVMLTPKQMGELLGALDQAEEAEADPVACSAIRVAFWTGWRISEVLGLRWENLDLETGTARLLKTKTAKEEYRMLPEEAQAVLEGLERVAGSPWVFPGRKDGEHLTTVRWTWKQVCKRAGLDNLPGLGPLRLHDLRHNVVSWDVSRGVSLEIAGKNVGHRSRQATEVYAHFAPDALKRAADERAKAMREAMDGSG